MLRSLSSFSVALVMLIVGAIGGVTSMLLTADRRWMEWHLSRLGEGGYVSSLIFNLTLVLCAVCLTAAGSLLRQEYDAIQQARAARVIQSSLYIAALCWMGVGIFPFDQFPVIHNIFGYGEFIILGMLMVLMSVNAGWIGVRTRTIGLTGVITAGCMMAAFHLTHFTTLLVVELVGQVFFSSWLLSLTQEASAFRNKTVTTID